MLLSVCCPCFFVVRRCCWSVCCGCAYPAQDRLYFCEVFFCFQDLDSSPVSCSGEMEYWTEAAVHATLRCVLACFVLCLFSLSSFVVALFVAFFLCSSCCSELFFLSLH